MKYDELRKLAEAATSGPWRWVEPHSVRRRYDQIFGDADAPIAAIEGLFSMRHRNGAYIAAASPDVILALLDERERLREVVRRLLEPAPDGAFDSGLDPNAELAAFMDIRHVAYKEARALLQATPANPEGVES